MTFDTLKREREAISPPNAESSYPDLHELIKPHLESFNAIKSSSISLLDMAIADLTPRVVIDSTGNRIKFCIDMIDIATPRIPESHTNVIDKRLFPSECRELGTTYAGRLVCRLAYSINGVKSYVENKQLGNIPIMVKSNLCHLSGLSPKELIKHHEEAEELGGYFIINGIEKLIRLLIVTRRNYPMAVVRPSFQKRGPSYTKYGVMIRCVRNDQSSHSVSIHYLSDGDASLRFAYRKQEYMLPLVMVLKSLIETTDAEIYKSIIRNDTENTFVTDRVELMLREFKKYKLHNREQCLTFIGEKFRLVLNLDISMTDEECGQHLLDRILLVHLDDNRDKFNLLIYMLQKLYSVVSGECAPENVDSPQHQEVLLGGFLYNNILKEKLEDWLNSIKFSLEQELRKKPDLALDENLFKKTLTKVSSNVGKMMEYFLATGNLVSNTGLDLMQASGYTIVAEKLNFYRYIAHFRSIHRGSFFAELKTTSVRKLLPEAWGFLCPVHTPDGAPCGLLNHLSHTCKIITNTTILDKSNNTIPHLCSSMGMIPVIRGSSWGTPGKTIFHVLLDGKLIGFTTPEIAEKISIELRLLKINGMENIPLDIEIALINESQGGQYPGLYIFSTPSRMMRPVKHVKTGKVDMIGSFEQVFMEVAVLDEDIHALTTHQEIFATNMLSVIANLTPFSDFNQSPRNMYQCQMGKQSMGTPCHAFNHRTDNKMYRLITGQTPVVRPKLHNKFGMDNYPNGFNAIVAVISYTGYDMEDAMILNKSAYERGLGHGMIYKSEFIDLSEKKTSGEPLIYHFGCNDTSLSGKLDSDGLPLIGSHISYGSPYYSYIDVTTNFCKVVRYKGLEDAIIDDVRLLNTGDKECQKICIKLRIQRNPVIGDKFSSRHGQKGVCSQKYPMIDMPFTESGMSPDIIINPHAFPSRMTIGMFVESMAGKAGALLGKCQDSTPFQFSENNTAVDFFGKQLKEAGYNYYGNEVMYSGITGKELKADIYIGVVYYQRLRHMVSDKFQVRTTGPIDSVTHQPVKGRKRQGGIRFGEMERDSLLAHGTSFLLQDRLMNCSDYSIADICVKCKSLVSPMMQNNSSSETLCKSRKLYCRICDKTAEIKKLALPYVFKYLAVELLSMNIKVELDIK